jgi:hypothetical protein
LHPHIETPPTPIPPPIATWVAKPLRPDWAILNKFPEPNVGVVKRVGYARLAIGLLILAAALACLRALYYVKQHL